MKRRRFVANSVSLFGSSLLTPALALKTKGAPIHERTGASKSRAVVRIGICADVHQDLMHDGERRLSAFIDEMNHLKPDFIIQLGDFCSPYEKNRGFVDLWHGFKGAAYHVIGNHDTDGGFSPEQVVDFWKAQGIYYSFDVNGYHFIVLNGNERPEGDTSRWPSHISEAQLNWLKTDLDISDRPVIIFCHQGFDLDVNGAIQQSTRVRVILERANEKAGFTKVQMVFTGHHHQDYHNVINGIHYVQINSMSYYWLGSKYRQMRYDETINKNHPWIRDTAPYKDPIWAFLTVYEDAVFEIKGKHTDFVHPSPKEMGFSEYEKVYPVVPCISDRIIKIDHANK